MLTYKELLPEEYDLIPAEALGKTLYTPENSKVVAAINARGEVVGTLVLFYTPHVEPLWIRPDYRKHPTLLRRIWPVMKGILARMGIWSAYTVILDDKPVFLRLADLWRFRPVSGKLFMYNEKE